MSQPTTCPVCGGPATVSHVAGIRITGCVCVPKDRAYMLPAGVAEPLAAKPHTPEGIVMLKVKP